MYALHTDNFLSKLQPNYPGLFVVVYFSQSCRWATHAHTTISYLQPNVSVCCSLQTCNVVVLIPCELFIAEGICCCFFTGKKQTNGYASLTGLRKPTRLKNSVTSVLELGEGEREEDEQHYLS
jgi:hypothetical protein